MVGPTTPLVVAYCRPPTPIAVVYFTESAKNASSAVIRFRRSDFIEARYAFSFVFANFGIAIAARMPMITTTIRSSMRVKPFWFFTALPPAGDTDVGRGLGPDERRVGHKKKRRGLLLAALMRQARGLTRTSARLPYSPEPAESNPRKSSTSWSSWC